MTPNYEAQLLDWFHHFHNHPEVSWREVETTNTLARILDQLGVSYQRFDDMTGLVAEIGQGDGVIAVRADIDALWQEVNGVMQGNHSCGHDANMSMVLGALLYVREHAIHKKVRFIFQPAEEKGEGALAMMERGVMEGVTHLYGVHLRPQEELPFGKVAPSIYHGAGNMLEGKIIGEDAHGARPHQGKNAIDVIVALHQRLKSIYISPFEAHSVKLTKLVAGGDSLNIIPGIASFALDVRAQKNDVLHTMQHRIEEALTGLKALYDVEIEYEWKEFTPGAEVSKEAEAITTEAIQQVIGEERTAPPVVTSGADDFHYYTIRYPDVKAAMIGVGADLTPGLHHPKMMFNTKALDIGARILAETIQRTP
ncbi:amidohydrolase [Pontibacillus litoralis]|uniref:Amidohydrolase n=1 Tax=Pontibacillus litoralis JSM 072002 TaxID=1385512 RepID=A0A0A5G7I0_9BACI|nr:amidohydrolase [Pontibacillus litoralis]KGX87035.1 amidohydrolase [Pontibacillus litoralis JSM 072002]